MALVNCKECNSRVSSKAATCPNCGATVASRPGFLAIGAAVVVGLVIVGAIDAALRPKSAARSSADPAITMPTMCEPSDISVEVHSTRVEYDYAYVTGRIINNCSSPTGVQLKVTLLDEQGGVITSHDPWPASISNIPARSDFPFEDQLSVNRRPAQADVRVIRVRRW
jgi:hypothetical protein